MPVGFRKNVLMLGRSKRPNSQPKTISNIILKPSSMVIVSFSIRVRKGEGSHFNRPSMDSSAVRKPNLKTEAIAGITTFFTMAYIVIVNPQILSADGKTGMAFSGVLTATVLVCFVMTLLMGIYAKLPFAVAPGMGINAFFTYTIVLGKGVPWPTALGIIFWAGVFFLLISVTPIRESIAKAIPTDIRIAAAAGIGIFLTFIGLKGAGFIVADPVTLVKIGALGKPALLTILGVALSILLMSRKSPFAFLATIIVVTVVAWALGLVAAPAQKLTLPDFKSVFP